MCKSDVQTTEVSQQEQMPPLSGSQCEVHVQLSFEFEEKEFALTEGPPTDWLAVRNSWFQTKREKAEQ